jgi:hypothetical protein
MPEDRTKEFLVESVAFFLIIAAFRKSNGTESLTTWTFQDRLEKQSFSACVVPNLRAITIGYLLNHVVCISLGSPSVAPGIIYSQRNQLKSDRY